MDKVLRLFTYVDGGINDTPFPDSGNPIEIGEFRYDAKRMGGAPTITASVSYPTCLDDVWTDMVYTELNGERYFLKQTPTSSKSNDDARYKHDLIFVAERVILDNAYFFDAVVGDPLENDKPVTNSTKFHFYGNIEDFVRRMNSSLQYTNLQKVDEEGNVISGYYVVLDDDVAKREDKLVSFDDAVFSQALQEAYNTFGVPFYFNGKEIHVGYSTNIIEDILEYGVDGALLSATRTNANFKVVNRATGEGSSDNIPYYYPNASSKGEISCEVNSVNPLSVVIVDAEEYANGIGIDETIEFVGAEYTIGNAEYYLPSPMRWDKYTPSNDVYLHFRNVGSKSSVKFRRKITTSGATSVEFYPTISWVKMQYSDGSVVDNFEQEKVQKHISLNVYKTGEKAFFTVDDIGVGGTTIEIPEAGEFCIETTVQAVNPFSLKNFSYIYFYVSYEDVVISDAGWHIGNKRVYLDEIGLSVSGNVTNGDTITQRIGKNISSSSALQPSIYRATDGKERFYNAINYPFAYEEGYELKYGEYILNGQVHNDVYKKDDGTYYEFTNEYKEGRPREHVFSVDDIKPTIKEMTNNISWVEQDEEGNNKTVFQRIDMFSEFAYNIGDNDETYTDPDGNTSFRHPYFFGKLRKLDFNLFECASEMGEMTFSMTSGHCGACNFKLGVDKDGQFNPVQVDENGNLIYDDRGYVLCGLEDFQGEVEAQDRQQDTINNEVWIALKKEDDTYGILMPKAPKYDEQGNLVDSGHRPVACSSENANDGDTFVILNINLPEEYILHAEKKLEKAIVKYIWENNVEKFNFSVNFSRIFLEENPSIANAINENARLTRVKYNGDEYVLYVSSYSYTMNEGDVLPEIRIELDDTLTIAQNALQNAINEVKGDIASAINAIDVAAIGSRYFLRKDTFDTAEAPINFKGGIFFGEGGDVSYYEDGSAKLTIDYLEVTKKATFTSLEIQEKTHAGGQILLTPAAMVCSRVEETSDAYRCYFQNEGEEGKVIFNQFAEGDQAISQTFNEWGGHYYWRLVTAVGEDYVDLSKTDCAPESDSPSVGDKIIQLGNRDDATRQNAIVIAAYGDNSPYIIQYKGINSFEIGDDKVVTKLSSTENIFTGKVHMELGSDGLDTLPEWIEVKETAQEALEKVEAMGENTFAELEAYINEVKDDLQSQIDGAIDSYFYEYIPTTENFPASEWTTNEAKEAHLNDTFTNLKDGRSWRWTKNTNGAYSWTEITDTATSEALAKAGKAQETADGKMTVFMSQPTPPYKAGDLWAGGEDQPLRRCINTKTSGSYNSSDWALADNAQAYANAIKAELELSVQNTKNALDKAIEDAEKASKDYTDEAKAAINQSIATLEQAKANVKDVYDKTSIDGKFTTAEQNANAKAKEYADAAQELAEENVKAWADGEIDDAEARAIAEAESKVNTAKNELNNAIQALEEDLETQISNAISSLNSSIETAKSESKNYTDSAKSDINTRISQVEQAKADIEDVYDKATADGKISDAEKKAIASANAYANSQSDYLDRTLRAWADGEIDDAEERAIAEAEAKVNAAKTEMEKYTDEMVNGMQIGGENLLRNSGFTGDYLSEQIADDSVLEGSLELYSPPFDHWEINVDTSRVELPNEAVSGYGVDLGGTSILQTLYYNVTIGDSYVVSFKAKTSSSSTIEVRCGGVSSLVQISSEWKSYSIVVEANSNNNAFSISGNAIICNLKLEKGNKPTSWSASPLDNRSDRAYYQSLKYVQDAFEGATDINGGLVLTEQIQVGDYDSEKKEWVKMNGGMSGIYESDNDVAFWAGGNFEKAVETAMTYEENPTYQPTEEELAAMANFVVTHGGRAILNEAIVRGMIYATEGNFGKGCTIGDTVRVVDGGIELDTRNKDVEGIVRISEEEGFKSSNDRLRTSFGGAGCSNLMLEVSTLGAASTCPEKPTPIGVWGDADGDAILCGSGMFAGLRTSSSYIEDLRSPFGGYYIPNTMSNILFPSSGTYNISLDSLAPTHGQEVWFETMGADINVTSTIPMWAHYYGEYQTSHSFTSAGVIRFKYYGSFSGQPNGIWTYTWVETR